MTLVFEDIHYADSGLLDFVDHLLDLRRGLPIFVVTLARPELIERRPTGAPASGTSSRCLSSLCPSRRSANSSPASCLGCRRRPCRRSSLAPRGAAVCGRDGAHAPRRGPARHRRRGLSPGRRPDQPGRPGDAHRADRGRLDGLDRATARCLRRRRSWARASPSPACRPYRDRRGRTRTQAATPCPAGAADARD